MESCAIVHSEIFFFMLNPFFPGLVANDFFFIFLHDPFLSP